MCADPAKSPKLCAPGTYQPQTGATSCLPCTSGQYSLWGHTQCNTCPAGYKCESVTKPPVKCQMGTYSNQGKTACSACTDGYICKSGSITATPTESRCPAGHYCKHTSSGLSVTPCKSGTYNPDRGQTTVSSCKPCEQGNFCLKGAYEMLTCTTGAVCPPNAKSNYDFPCGAGKYLDKYNATSQTQCLTCPERHYCPILGLNVLPTKCPPGYFCPEGSGSYASNPCPAGTYGGLDSLKASSECKDCPKGHYCPRASVFPTACGTGTYLDTTRAQASGECKKCPAGTVCPFYGLTHPYTEIYCEPGHACPSGTSFKYENPCPDGKYYDGTNLVDVANCQACPAGYACAKRTFAAINWMNGATKTPLMIGANTLSNPKQACQPGHWCGEGSTSPTQNACPAGTYSPAFLNNR